MALEKQSISTELEKLKHDSTVRRLTLDLQTRYRETARDAIEMTVLRQQIRQSREESRQYQRDTRKLRRRVEALEGLAEQYQQHEKAIADIRNDQTFTEEVYNCS